MEEEEAEEKQSAEQEERKERKFWRNVIKFLSFIH